MLVIYSNKIFGNKDIGVGPCMHVSYQSKIHSYSFIAAKRASIISLGTCLSCIYYDVSPFRVQSINVCLSFFLSI